MHNTHVSMLHLHCSLQENPPPAIKINSKNIKFNPFLTYLDRLKSSGCCLYDFAVMAALSLELHGMKRLRITDQDEDEDFEEPPRKRNPFTLSNPKPRPPRNVCYLIDPMIVIIWYVIV